MLMFVFGVLSLWDGNAGCRPLGGQINLIRVETLHSGISKQQDISEPSFKIALCLLIKLIHWTGVKSAPSIHIH
jgi:hypothetical protein